MVGMRASEEMILKLLFLDRCSSSVHDLRLKTMEGRMPTLWISLGMLKLLGCPISIVEGVGDDFISVRESLIS